MNQAFLKYILQRLYVLPVVTFWIGTGEFNLAYETYSILREMRNISISIAHPNSQIEVTLVAGCRKYVSQRRPTGCPE